MGVSGGCGLEITQSWWEWAENEWEWVKNEWKWVGVDGCRWKWVGARFSITLYFTFLVVPQIVF